MNIAFNQIDDNAIVALNDADLNAVSGGFSCLSGLLSFKASLFSKKSSCTPAPKCEPKPAPAPKPCKTKTSTCGKPC